MKRITGILCLMLLLMATVRGANGDTTRVKVFDQFPMTRYGAFDKKALMPASNVKSQRIWLKYTLGCEANGQCEWDYTIKLFARQHTGKKDSTARQAPSFKVAGALRDSFAYSLDTTYTYKFNTVTKRTDSTANPAQAVILFGDVSKPLMATDTFMAWTSGYYNYIYDTLGKKSDSLFTDVTETLRLTYTPYFDVFDVVNNFEIGRLISPYAIRFPKSFKYDYVFDVTDFAWLLHDSLELRIVYEGYSYGFTATWEMQFIEGTPAREAINADIIYNDYYVYGSETNPIEAKLSAKSFTIPADAGSAKLRIAISGHGGESSENCAEFCKKNYYLKMDNVQIAEQAIWRDNCGENPIINQGGTWIYNRANWCPGELITTFDYPVAFPAGTTHTMDMDLQSFIASGPAGYSIAAYIVYYKPNTRTTDVGIEDIIAPSKNFWHNRVNPICENARIKIRNWGSEVLTSAEISYQVGDASASKFNWNGTLAFNAEEEVRLPYLNWSSNHANKTFKVWVSKVNGKNISSDQNGANNMMTSEFDIPQKLPNEFIIETMTNAVPFENSYTIHDEYQRLVVSKTFTKASTLHRDTIKLGAGCYSFEFKDEGGSGLSFFALPSQGNGTIRFRTVSPVSIIKSFNPDFGSFLKLNFTVQYGVGVDEYQSQLNNSRVYPSPANDIIFVESDAEIVNADLMDISGRIVTSVKNTADGIRVGDLPSGVYMLRLLDAKKNFTVKKVSIVH